MDPKNPRTSFGSTWYASCLSESLSRCYRNLSSVTVNLKVIDSIIIPHWALDKGSPVDPTSNDSAGLSVKGTTPPFGLRWHPPRSFHLCSLPRAWPRERPTDRWMLRALRCIIRRRPTLSLASALGQSPGAARGLAAFQPQSKDGHRNFPPSEAADFVPRHFPPSALLSCSRDNVRKKTEQKLYNC